ncbi:MAG TPA: MFS transporter [Sumerlaeia bacterium]|nr:MFS transporter [Sumerlaeia bacterium]
MQSGSKNRWFRRAQVRFGANYFLLFSLFAIVAPYFQVLLAERGFDKLQIGFILGVTDVVGLGAPTLWAWVSDRSRHRRSLIVLSTLGSAVIFSQFGWVSTFSLAVAASAFFGFFFRPLIPLTDGLVLRYQEAHGGDYGRPRTSGSIAFVGVVLMLEWLGVADRSRTTGVILASLAVVALLHAVSAMALPLTDADREERRRKASGAGLSGADGAPVERRRFDWAIVRSRPFVLFAVVVFLSRAAMVSHYSFFTLYVKEEIGFAEAGKLWTLGALFEIPFVFFSGWFIRRIGVRNLFALGVASAVVRLGGYALAPDVGWVVALQALHALYFGAYYVALLTYVSRLAPPHMKQSLIALFFSVSFGPASVVGSMLGGALSQDFGFRVMYAIFSVVACVAFILVLVFLREPKAVGNADPAK